MARNVLSLLVGCAVAALSWAIVENRAHAWGPEGHRIVAAIAEKNLSPKAKTELAKLLEPDTGLSDIANYADAYRSRCKNTGAWHFVDIPLDANAYEEQRDCNEASGSCILPVLERELGILSDRSQSVEEREFALRFIVHFAGDLHQPLHCADNKDHGGNQVQIRVNGRTTNLHKLWDSGLIDAQELSEAQYVRAVLGSATRAEKRGFQRGSPLDWALEAHKAAQAFAYGQLGTTPTTSKVIDLPDGYFDAVIYVLNEQLLKAGVRLAKLLNEALAKPGPKVNDGAIAANHVCAVGT